MNGILLWQQIREAGRQRVCVELYYDSAKSKERKRYTVIPWSIRSPKYNLTLYVWDVNEEKMKQLRFDRIIRADLLKDVPWSEEIVQKVGYPMEVSYPEITDCPQYKLIPLKENKHLKQEAVA